MLWSRFKNTHIFSDVVAVFSSLKLSPVYLTKEVYRKLDQANQQGRLGQDAETLEEVRALTENRCIVDSSSVDDELIADVRSQILASPAD